MIKREELEQTAARLNEATERLKTGIETVEKAIIELHIGVSVSLDVEINEIRKVQLEFCKSGGAWGFFVTMDGGVRAPLGSAPRIVRIMCAKKLDLFPQMLLDEATRQIAAAAEAEQHIITTLELVDQISGSTEDHGGGRG